MKKIISSTGTVIVLLVLTIAFLAFYAYMIARPISYGMEYYSKTNYEGHDFESIMVLTPDGTMNIRSTTFYEGMDARYYYKNGYLFSLVAITDEEYEEEVKYINENFEEALEMPFYADRINAFAFIADGADGYSVVYTCTPAIVFAIVGAVIELILIAATVISLVFFVKNKSKIKEIQ